MRLEFKFRESAPAAQRQHVVDKVKQLGAQKVERVFPDDADAELASLYKAEGVPDESVDRVVATLDNLDEVEFAEPARKRKLIT